MKLKTLAAATIAALSFSGVANASVAIQPSTTGTFEVLANQNSSSGGTGLDTLSLFAGQQFSVSVNPNDLWNAGPLPRWSNANGLTGNLYYVTGTDSQVTVVSNGTKIGQAFDPYSQGGLSTAYGTLVGQIGSGSFFAIGTNYTGTAASAGTLKLYYWDSNNGDNSGSIMASVTAVPEPETYAMYLAGLGLMGFMSRRRSIN